MNDSAVFAAFANRITADKLPDIVTYPCARVWVVVNPQSYQLAGENGRAVLAQIDVYDDDIAGADANVELIRSSLSGFQGQMGNVNVGRAFVRNVAGVWNAEAKNYHRILEVEIGTND